MKLPPVVAQGRRLKIIQLITNGFFQAIVMVGFTFLIKEVFDGFIYTNDTNISLWKVGSYAVIIITALAWLKYRERSDAESLGQDYVHGLRKQMFSLLCESDLRQLERHGQGDIILRFATDLTALRQWVSLGMARLVVACTIIILSLSAVCFINFSLGVVVGIALLINLLLSFFIGYRLEHTFREARRSRSYLANNLAEKVNSLYTVNVSGQRKREKQRIARQSLRVMNSMVARAKAIGINRGITEGSMMLATTAALIAGAILIGSGSTTPGAVVAAMTIIALLTQSTRNIGRVYEYWHGARIAREKIESFLDDPVPARKIHPPRLLNSSLILKDIWSPGSNNYDEIAVSPGKKIVVVGDNGAGKSTLLKEIAGVIKPRRGKVLLNNIDVMELHEKYLRNMMGMVSPELPLIRGTIRKNICYRRPSAEPEEIAQAVELSGLKKFLMQFADGIEHRVSRGGKNLSLGQQQTIILARAILGSPEILLLDEADSFLDGEMRRVFTDIVINYSGTVIMATHNLKHITLANEIWVLKNGQLAWQGPPDEFNAATINQKYANYQGH